MSDEDTDFSALLKLENRAEKSETGMDYKLPEKD